MVTPPLIWIAASLLAVSIVLVRVVRGRRRLQTAWSFLGIWLCIWAASSIPGPAQLIDPQLARALNLAILALVALQILAIIAFDLLLRDRVPKVINEIIILAGYATIVLNLLYKLGVNVTGIFATSAVATAIVGLALQDMLGNIAGGIALEVERSVRPGDYIRCGEYSGWVLHVRMRHTSITTKEGDTVILPNSQMTRSPVSICGSDHRQEVHLTMPYSFNPQDVINTVESALISSPLIDVAASPAPRCVVSEMNADAIRYTAFIWLKRPGHFSEAVSAVNLRLYFALQRAGISAAPIPRLLEMRSSDATLETINPLKALRSTPILRLLSDADLFELGSQMSRMTFAPGEFIIRQGDSDASMYFVIKGDAQVLYRSPTGEEREIAEIKSGNFFGENSLLTGEARTASVLAKTVVECYRLEKEGVHQVVARRPELMEDMSIVMTYRQAELSQAREELDLETARRRETENQNQLLGRIRRFFGVSTNSTSAGD